MVGPFGYSHARGFNPESLTLILPIFLPMLFIENNSIHKNYMQDNADLVADVNS